MRRFLCALIGVTLLITCAPSACASQAQPIFAKDKFIQPVRLHVVADSDEDSAQALKLIVRNEVAAYARALTQHAKSAAEAYTALVVNLNGVRAVARKAAMDAGFEGEIRVRAGVEAFPARLYGNVLMEEGEYHTLRVEIGKAEGRNWWCVLYPSLCLYGTPDEESPTQITFYSSILDWFERWFHGGNDE